MAQVVNPLRYMCLTHLDGRDYLFLLLIGFSSFLAGTVVAWLTGMCVVLYQTLRRRSEDSEEEEEFSLRMGVGQRMLKVKSEQGQFLTSV